MAINNTGINTCNETLTFSTYSSKTFSIGSDNTRTICYRAVDVAENITYLVSDVVTGISNIGANGGGSSSSEKQEISQQTTPVPPVTSHTVETTSPDARDNDTQITIVPPSNTSHPTPLRDDAPLFTETNSQETSSTILPLNITPQRSNHPADVIKLQQFLNDHEGESLEITGIYDGATQNAVKRFQVKYASEILSPLGLRIPTGNV